MLCWRELSLHIRPSTPDGKTWGLGFKWNVTNVASLACHGGLVYSDEEESQTWVDYSWVPEWE